MGHVPVMLEEVVRVLDPQPGEVYVDCTAGLGGHAAALARRLGPAGTVVLNDADPVHLVRTGEEVAATGARVVTMQGNFAALPRRLIEAGLVADVVLADLGFASTQVEDAARGFSFNRPGPLDMRMDPTLQTTAADLVASLPEPELERIISEYGEDRRAGRIASKLVAERARTPILTTDRLADVVRAAVGSRGDDRIDPATRTFQALRIAVNDELGSLAALLRSVERACPPDRPGAEGWLTTGARIGMISFHSLEDRLVKRSFRGLVDAGRAEDLTRRPIEASSAEIDRNPRARSAKLRAIRVRGVSVDDPTGARTASARLKSAGHYARKRSRDA